jgi:hypothetical protein
MSAKQTKSLKKLAKEEGKLRRKEKALSRRIKRPSEQNKTAANFANASKVAMSIAAPQSSYMPRLSSAFTDTPTAVAKPYERDDVTTGWSDEAAIIPAGTVFGALYRDPCRAILYSRACTSDSTYTAYGTGGSDIVSRTPPSTSWSVPVPTVGVSQGVGLTYWRNTVGDDPHGPILCCGTPSGDDGDEDRFTWCDDNTVITLNATLPNAVVGGLELETYEWTPEGVRLSVVQSVTTVAATPVATIVKGTGGASDLPAGYYCFRFVAKGAIGSPMTITMSRDDTLDSLVICHKPLPKWESWYGSAQGIRINAGSITLSNATPLLERGGLVAAYQAPQGSHWFDYATDFSEISSAQGAAQIDAKNGMYTWLSPAAEEDLFFLESYETEDGVLYDTYYPLNPKHQFLVMQMKESSSSGAFFEGFFSFHFGVEFMTDDVSREVADPDVKKADYDLAFELIKKMPKYAENPTHWATLLDSISKGAKEAIKWGVKNAPTLINVAEMVGKLALL